jgi:hypothetical protein
MKPRPKRKLISAELLQLHGSGVKISTKPLLIDGNCFMWKLNARSRV